MKNIFLVTAVLFFCGSFAVQANAAKEWNEYKADHFIIYYKSIPMDFVKSVESAAEEYYRDIAEWLSFHREEGWAVKNRAKIYIYDDANDYTANAINFQWSHGAAFASEKTIRTFPSAHGFFDSTLPHEMTHIIFRECIGLETKVPLWFEEGVAMYQEKAKRFGSHRIVQTAVEKGEFIPLKELTLMRLYNNSPDSQVELFYAESASVVYFIINEQGEHNFVRLCRALKEGKPFAQALQDVYFRFKSLDDLNRAWLNYLESIDR